MSKKPTFNCITDNIFGLNIYWMVGTRGQYRGAVLREFGKINPDKDGSVLASFEVFVREDIQIGVIWLSKKSASMAAHECLHAVHWILQRKGLWLTDSSEEVYAYYIEYLVTQICMSFRKGMVV